MTLTDEDRAQEVARVTGNALPAWWNSLTDVRRHALKSGAASMMEAAFKAGVDAALLSAARQARTQGPGDVAWLIEWPGEAGGQTRWWHPVRGWQINACDAIRFARNVDAEDFRSRYRLQGKVTEHVFVPAPPASQIKEG